MENKKHKNSEAEKTPKVTGIGGVFFFSDDPEKAKEWYSTNLGHETNEYGSTIEIKNVNIYRID